MFEWKRCNGEEHDGSECSGESGVSVVSSPSQKSAARSREAAPLDLAALHTSTASLRELIDGQLVAMERILAVSTELLYRNRRADSREAQEDLKKVIAPLQMARKAMKEDAEIAPHVAALPPSAEPSYVCPVAPPPPPAFRPDLQDSNVNPGAVWAPDAASSSKFPQNTNIDHGGGPMDGRYFGASRSNGEDCRALQLHQKCPMPTPTSPNIEEGSQQALLKRCDSLDMKSDGQRRVWKKVGGKAGGGGGGGSSGVFADAAAFKEQIKQQLEHGDSGDAEELYWKEGWTQKIATNENFKNLTFLVIFLSSIWIAVDTDLNKPGASPNIKLMFLAVDNIICTYFTFEMLMRFLSFRDKKDAFTLTGFNFDLLLVIFMVGDTWVMPAVSLISGKAEQDGAGSMRILRLVRLVRLARLGRLIRMCPDLIVLVRGMTTAMRAVSTTMALLIVIIYVFAVLFTQMLSEREEVVGEFETVPQSMNTLLLQGVFDGQSPLIMDTLNIHWIYYVCIMVFFTIEGCCVMNMLIGVVCEVISSVAKAEADARIIINMHQKIKEAVLRIDENNDGSVTKDEFKDLLEDMETFTSLKDAEIDVLALIDSADLLFKEGPLSVEDFRDAVIQFRTKNTCTVKDVIELRRSLLHEIEKLLRERWEPQERAQPQDRAQEQAVHGNTSYSWRSFSPEG